VRACDARQLSDRSFGARAVIESITTVGGAVMPKGDVKSVHLPYCIQRKADGSYIVLNRDYKPIGFTSKKNVDYDAFPISVRFKRLTKTTLLNLSWENKPPDEEGRTWLYCDYYNPVKSSKDMREYLARLEILAKLKLEVEH
jgi:hypothetical protein